MSEATLVAEASIPAPGRNLCGLAWDGSHLWHADAGTSLLYCLDPQSGTVMRTLEVRDVRTCTDYADGMLWQIAGRPKTLCELDPETGAVRRAIPLRSETICGLQLVGDHFWTTEEEGRLLWCRLEDAAVERELQAVPRIAGVASALDSLWYTVDEAGLIVRVAATDGQEVARYSVGGTPTGIGWDGERLWYADQAAKRLVAARLRE
jgi:streptogramin lyase